MVKEYGQDCNKCEKLCMPMFDLEATHKAASKVIERIKKVFYNQEPAANENSERY